MPAKRAREEGAQPEAGDAPAPKKAKHGFRVGPENLPDGAWRRKGNHSTFNSTPCLVVTLSLI